MAMGRGGKVPSPGYVFYDRLQKLLAEVRFDAFVEETRDAPALWSGDGAAGAPASMILPDIAMRPHAPRGRVETVEQQPDRPRFGELLTKQRDRGRALYMAKVAKRALAKTVRAARSTNASTSPSGTDGGRSLQRHRSAAKSTPARTGQSVSRTAANPNNAV